MADDKYSPFQQAIGSAANKAALELLPFLRDPDDVKKALALAGDRQEDTSLRILALEKVMTPLDEDTGYIRMLMNILHDKGEPTLLRRAVFHLLRIIEFGSRIFLSFRPDYMALLRELIDDPDADLRAQAAQKLAMEKDEFVQRRLIDGLRDPSKAVVPTYLAMEFLRYDIHAEHLPVVRNLLENETTDEATKVAAINVLAIDPLSKNLLMNLMQDKKQPEQVRMSSIVAFNTGHPADFLALAKPMILDETENEQVRARSLSALLLHRDSDAVFKDTGFLRKMSALPTSARSPELQKLSTHFLHQAETHNKKP